MENKNKELLFVEYKQEETYLSIRRYIINAQNRVKTAVNHAMIKVYWDIGEQIHLACGENERAAYGKQIL